MTNQKLHRLQWYVVALTTLFVATHLAWEYSHGGVVSHHFLARPDLPAISNWWGLVVLPILGWLASWSVQRQTATKRKALLKATAAAFGALLVGIALSITFITGHGQISNYIALVALLSGLILPTYRAEYIFGFVLGMAFVLGAVLPTIFALVAAGISAVFHLAVRPAFAWAVRRHVPND